MKWLIGLTALILFLWLLKQHLFSKYANGCEIDLARLHQKLLSEQLQKPSHQFGFCHFLLTFALFSSYKILNGVFLLNMLAIHFKSF